jgi:exosortase/archaeosortase family protein
MSDEPEAAPGDPPDAARMHAKAQDDATLRREWLRFAGIFAAVGLSLEVFYQGFALESAFFQVFLEGLAQATGFALDLVYDGVRVDGARVSIPRFIVEVDYGCDGIQVCTLLASAVIAFPAPWKSKLIGITVGLVWLQVWNVMRIATLVSIGRHLGYVKFETAHIYVWPTILVILSLLSWIFWVRWATRDAA